ncbi:MAG: hypothetical protein GY807_14525 [Gammaproteobacteria bacterium]|nr:hypothetical protein [Gammaproteobacteria bacterium]
MQLRNPKWLILLLVVCLPLQAIAAPYLQGCCDMVMGTEWSPEAMDSSEHDCCQDGLSASLPVCDQCVVCALTAGTAVTSGFQALPLIVLQGASLPARSSSMHSRFNDTLYKPPRIL